MKTMAFNIFTFLLCYLFSAQNISASGFKIVKKQNGIVLYERWITGTNSESVRELKAEFTVKSNTQNIIHLLKNQSEGTNWNPNASAYKIANTIHEGQWINYIRYKMPAFMNDQECCLLYQLSSDFSEQQKVCIVNFKSTLCPAFPANPNVKRITGIKGQWILERQPHESMKVTYIITSDKSSNIPRFISDPIVHNNLFKTITNFRTLLEK